MSVLRNLLPGQYQIGDLVFGRGTTVRVETFDIKPYDVNNQDYQVSRSDERRFGWDQQKPTTIEITFHVMYNKMLPGFEDTKPNFWADMPTVQDFVREWKSNDVRGVWNELKPLYYCPDDGITRVIFGRPGQLTYGKKTEYTESVQCLGEFRRADTLTYSAYESSVELYSDEDPSYITRTTGDADTWLRIVGIGPLTNPVITIGEQQISLDLTIGDGEIFEISSYPWQRRALTSGRVNISANMIGETRFLDQIKLPIDERIPVRWTSDEFKTFIPALGNRSWADDLSDDSWWNPPEQFDLIEGNPVIWWDLVGVLWKGRLRRYIGPGPWGATAAVVYNAEQYNTASQFLKATVVPRWPGRSALAIMCDDTMTSFVCLEVQAKGGIWGGNYLRIHSGTAWNALTQRAQWEYTDPLGWLDEDEVSIGYDPATYTYSGYLNGEEKLTWVDSTPIVPTGTDNRYHGFIFDLDNGLFTAGPGFADIVCYDTATSSTTGQVFLGWRDAWHGIL